MVEAFNGSEVPLRIRHIQKISYIHKSAPSILCILPKLYKPMEIGKRM